MPNPILDRAQAQQADVIAAAERLTAEAQVVLKGSASLAKEEKALKDSRLASIQSQLINDLKPAHVTGLFGARRTGKTILMQQIKDQLSNKKILMVNGEDMDVAELLASQRSQVLKNLVTGYDYLFIDEAQKVPGIGENLKLMVRRRLIMKNL